MRNDYDNTSKIKNDESISAWIWFCSFLRISMQSKAIPEIPMLSVLMLINELRINEIKGMNFVVSSSRRTNLITSFINTSGKCVTIADNDLNKKR